MRVQKLINDLVAMVAGDHLSPDAVARAYNADSKRYEPITGFLYDKDHIELQTDSDEEE